MAAKPRVLLDLDCTLADFIGGVARLWGVGVAGIESFHPAGTYDCREPLAAAVHQCHGGRPRPRNEAEFWAKIEACSGFWADLPELPWCRELLDLVRATTDDWWVVTAPSRCPRCIPEKRRWLDRVLGTPGGGWYDRMIPTPHKYLLASPGTCLIDDHDANCRDFVTDPVRGTPTGGHAITLPCHHNSMHAHKADPMAFVRPALDSWVRRGCGGSGAV